MARRDVLGVAFLGSGAALVVHISLAFSLRLALLIAIAVIGTAVSARYVRGGDEVRSLIRRRAKVGLVAGVVATAAYDTTRALIAALGLVTVDPFESIPLFGALIVPAATPTTHLVVGVAYHVVNGIFFAIAFSLLVSSPTWLKGAAWAIALESAQLLLYPAWLEIQRFSEFAQVSVAAHVVYGTVLGSICGYLVLPPGSRTRDAAVGRRVA